MPSNNPNVLENLNPPWQKGESGNPKGRPIKLINSLAKSVNVDFRLELTKQDKTHLIEWMLERTVKEVKTIAENDDSPVFLVLISSAITADTKAGTIRTVETIFDRVFGKAPQIKMIKQ